MSAIKLSTPSSGSISLSPADTASNLTITVPATTATMAIDGPAFSAFASSSQSISNITQTKVVLNSEQFDTANCFDSTTNYRFTPNVAGYYQIQGTVYYQGGGSGQVNTKIYKNGAEAAVGFFTPASGADIGATVSALFYMNGSSDYVELYTYHNSGSSRSTFGASPTLYTYFQGFLVRAA
jgi:hypothetical protein